MQTMKSPDVLVIEDDPQIKELLSEVLTDEGYLVTVRDSALGAMALVRRLRPAVILLDLGLPYRSGATLLSTLKDDQETATIPVIIVSGMPDILTDERSRAAYAVFPKPFSLMPLLAAVREASNAVE
jgi:DNA-binding response OmpR family regulator